MASQKDGIPTSWASCTVADITLPVGKVDPKSNPNREIRYIDISGIDNQSNKIADTKTYTLSQAPSRARQIVQAGDVVFSTVRPYLRNIASVGTALDGEIASTGFAVLRPAEGIAPEFLFYKTTSQEFVEEISGKQYGASYPAVKDSQVRSVALSLPPSNEQRRIVEKIETLFARLDQGEAALRQVQKLLARYRQSVLKAAVTGALTRDWRAENAHRLEHGRDLLARILQTRRETWQGRGQYKEPAAPDTTGLPELPEGWVWASLAQLTSIKGGVTVDKKREATDPVTVPYLRVANVQNGYLDLAQVKDISVDREKAEQCLLEPGDILLNEGGDRDKLGRGWVWGGEISPCIHQNHVFRARPVMPEVSSKFISYYANAFGQPFFMDKGKQSVNLASISLTAISGLPVPLPPIHEQYEIVAALEAKLSEIVVVLNVAQTELTRSAALRQSILKDAFAGKLVPQDPADEPAAELLARIRASRAAERKKPSRRRASA